MRHDDQVSSGPVPERRKTGISAVGDIPWGAHFCHFYETKQDLVDILVPFFRTGLENNEFCMWVMFDQLDEAQAIEKLSAAVPSMRRHIAAGDIEFLPYSQWYVQDGTFDLDRVLKGWNEKLEQALAKGYAGMRVSGDGGWSAANHSEVFEKYEERMNSLIANQKMIVLCTYPLAITRAAELFEMARSHQFAIAKRNGDWEVLETPALKKAKEELRALSEQLEQRVADRTIALEKANDELRAEIADRKRAEELLYESEGRFRQLAENINEVFWMCTPDFRRTLYVSPAYERIWGRSQEGGDRDIQSVFDSIHPEDWPRMGGVIAAQTEFSIEYRIIRPDGSIRWIWSRGFPVRDQAGQIYRFCGVAADITDRRDAAERLKATNDQLRALSASVHRAREEEGTRIAREIHDELGSALTSMKWDLEELDKLLAHTEANLPAVQEKLDAMMRLADQTIVAVRRIASDLRPGILDDLGLVDAIEWQAKDFQARTGIRCRCEHILDEANLNPEQSSGVYRILQEALTNIMRHAQARSVEIAMVEQPEEFILTITDDGKGITEEETNKGLALGLLGMKEQAHLLGGSVDISGASGGRGTTVTVRVPTSSPKSQSQ
jgi:PAS domain S-box-containing protein